MVDGFNILKLYWNKNILDGGVLPFLFQMHIYVCMFFVYYTGSVPTEVQFCSMKYSR